MNDKIFAEAFAKELQMETPSTLKCLERIPAELFGYKPHEKSMNMGYLAHLVAEIPLWITHMLTHSEIDFATFQHAKITSPQDLVNHFKENVDGAVKSLAKVAEGDLDKPFYLKNNGQVVFTATIKQNLESTINHMVHHRGQLTVYMRLNNIAVPSIYGPSADERNF